MWLLLLILAARADAPAPAPPPDIPLDAVVLLQQGAATCAGSFVDGEGTVVTAYHCVAEGGRPRVWTHDGRSAIGRVGRVDPALDLALVEVPDFAGEPSLPLRTDPPALGETIRPIGHPFGARLPFGFVEGTLRWSVSQGVVSAVGPRAIQTTAPVNPGNSGGPLVDLQGRLVGVVSRRYSGQGLGFAARARGVQALLDGGGHVFGPVGGTVGLNVFLSNYEAGLGSLAVGARLELAFRDRVVLALSGAFPLGARWSVTRFGEEVRWSQLEARAGLRQRLFHGQWTTTLDAYGGVAAVQGLAPDTTRQFRNQAWLAPMAGGSVQVASAGLDLAALWVDGSVQWRLCITLRWPGVFWMF